MKLLHCHIENFGNLTNVDYNFSSGITQFCEQNGFGKTTLASFIKAMFYGLPPYRSNTKDFNDRKHFYPFNGGKFGGNLEFEVGGKSYRIERFFDKKSDVDDTCLLFLNNKVISEGSKDIGKTIFGLDKDSFERTVFITADDVEISLTSGINAKLNSIVENSDESTFDKALETLESSRKALKATRGTNDLITATSENIDKLNNRIRNIESVADAVNDYYKRLNALKVEIANNEEQVKKSNEQNILIEKWNQYQSMLTNKIADEQQLENIKNNYPSGIPTTDELSTLKNCNTALISLNGQGNAKLFDGLKQQRLNDLASSFAKGVPSTDELYKVQDAIDQVVRLNNEIMSIRGAERNQHEGVYESIFNGRIPSDSDMQVVKGKVERVRDVENKIKLLTDKAYSSNTRKANGTKNRGAKYLAVLIFSLIVIAVGGVACIFNAIAGGIVVGVASLMLIYSGYLYLTKRNAAISPAQHDIELAKLQAERNSLTESIRTFLTPYGYYSQNGIIYDFATFENNLNEYLAILSNNARRESDIIEREKKVVGLSEVVRVFLSKYVTTTDNMQTDLTTLERKIAEFHTLTDEKNKAGASENYLKQKIEETNNVILGILDKYNLPVCDDLSAQFEEISRASEEKSRLAASIKRWTEQAEAYKTENNLTEKPTGQTANVDELNEHLSHSRRELAVVEGQIVDAELMVEQLDDLRNNLENETEKLKQYKVKYAIITATINSLKQAEQNLKDKYIAPIKDKFIYYSQMLEKALGEKVSMDQDFQITFERGGENRSDKHFSAGQRNIIALCYRFALIDNMYQNESPFIILDDPLVNLDQNHIEKARNLLIQLAKDKQIIYFSCHESRKI